MGWMPQPKDKDWLNGYKNKTPTYVVYKRPTSTLFPYTTLFRSDKYDPIAIYFIVFASSLYTLFVFPV